MKLFSAIFLLTFSIRSGQKPNIVLILADDVGFEEYGIYGVPKGTSKTLNIDKIGESAVTLQTCWGQAICGHSRGDVAKGVNN